MTGIWQHTRAMSNPYRSPQPVYHTIHLSPAEVLEAIRVYADAHSHESFPAGKTRILLRTAEGGTFTAEVTGPDVDILPHADEQR